MGNCFHIFYKTVVCEETDSSIEVSNNIGNSHSRTSTARRKRELKQYSKSFRDNLHILQGRNHSADRKRRSFTSFLESGDYKKDASLYMISGRGLASNAESDAEEVYSESTEEVKYTTPIDLSASFDTEVKDILLFWEDVFLRNIERKNSLAFYLKIDLKGKRLSTPSIGLLCTLIENHLDMLQMKLDLSATNLNDENLITIINSFEKLEHLLCLKLILRGNKITYKGGRFLSERIPKIVTLKKLSLDLAWNEELSGNALEELAGNLIELENLEEFRLDLQCTKIATSDLFLIELKENVSNLPLLSRLELNFACTKLPGNVLSLLFSQMKNFQLLKELGLDLGYNHMSEETFRLIIRNLSKAEYLESLRISLAESSLTFSDIEPIFKSVSQLPYLKILDLDSSNNYHIHNNNNFLIDYINPEEVFPSLEVLKLNCASSFLNKSNYENISIILHCLKKIRVLKLNLSSNGIASEGLENILGSLARLKHLEALQLDLRNSSLKGDMLNVLLFAMKFLAQLKKLGLKLRNNEVTSKAIMQVAQICSGMKNLRQVRIDAGAVHMCPENERIVVESFWNHQSLDTAEVHINHNRKIEIDLIDLFNKLMTDRKRLLNILEAMREDICRKNKVGKREKHIISDILDMI